jgi:CO/xanthine dehydrogenase Mo-binding subunit
MRVPVASKMALLMAAAINNAIFEATGTRIRRAPLNAAHIKAASV